MTARVTMTARRGHRVHGKCSHEASSARRMFVAFRQAQSRAVMRSHSNGCPNRIRFPSRSRTSKSRRPMA